MNVLFDISLMFLDVMAMLNVVLIVDVAFGAKLDTSGRKLLFASALMLILEIILEAILPLESKYLIALFEYVFMLAAVIILAREKKIKASFMTIPAVLVYTQWGMIGYLVERIFHFRNVAVHRVSSDITPATFIADITLLFILFKLKKSKLKDVSLTFGEGLLLTLFCFFSPMITGVLESLETQIQDTLFNLAWMVFVLVLNFFVAYGIFYRKRARYYKNMTDLYRNQFDVEYAYFKEYKDNNKDVIRFRHDWNNHMIVMRELLEQGKYEEAKKYFESFPVAQKGKNQKLLTGNETVDTIFAAKMDRFLKDKIELVFDGNLARISSMEPVDICIIFSNLIDNALEELAKLEGKRYFHITVEESPNVTMIIFKNNMMGEPVFCGDVIKSAKDNPANHGIGLQNVKEILAKYSGEFIIDAQNGEFSIKVILPI